MRIPPFYIRQHPDEFLRGIVRRETRLFKRGTLITIGGSTYRKTGTGKSWTALRIGEYNDKDYQNGASKVVYFIKDFLKVMDEVERTARRYIGQVVVVDEAGSLISADQWRSVINKAVAYTVQTFRYLRCAVVLVMPQRSLIDKRVRTLADYHISMDVVSYSKIPPNKLIEAKIAYLATPYAVMYDEWTDKTYRLKLFGYLVNKRSMVRLIRVPIRPLQSEALKEEYEKLSVAYKKKLRELVSNDIRVYEDSLKKRLDIRDVEKIVNAIANNQELIQSIIKRRKVDKDLLALALENAFPDTDWDSKTVGLIQKILNKRVIGLGVS